MTALRSRNPARNRDRWLSALLLILVAGCSADDSAVEQPASESRNTEEVPQANPSTERPQPFDVEEGFTLLKPEDLKVFHGESSSGGNTWGAEGTTITCSGEPRGYCFTRKSYRNFTLRFDYRFAEPDDADADPNTGVLVYITGENKLWPVSLEVQGKHSRMAAIKANGGAPALEVEDDEAARQEARNPVGRWNSVKVVARDGALTSYLNGTKIAESEPGELKEGPLGFQSEDFEVHFRNVRIREE